MSGDVDFKGLYKYNETLIKTSVNKTCAYQGGGGSPQIGRKCIGNLQNGPKWQIVQTEVCAAKYATTNDLLHLTKASQLILWNFSTIFSKAGLSYFLKLKKITVFLFRITLSFNLYNFIFLSYFHLYHTLILAF